MNTARVDLPDPRRWLSWPRFKNPHRYRWGVCWWKVDFKNLKQLPEVEYIRTPRNIHGAKLILWTQRGRAWKIPLLHAAGVPPRTHRKPLGDMLRGHFQNPSIHQDPSESIKIHQNSPKFIRIHQNPSESIRIHQHSPSSESHKKLNTQTNRRTNGHPPLQAKQPHPRSRNLLLSFFYYWNHL